MSTYKDMEEHDVFEKQKVEKKETNLELKNKISETLKIHSIR